MIIGAKGPVAASEVKPEDRMAGCHLQCHVLSSDKFKCFTMVVHLNLSRWHCLLHVNEIIIMSTSVETKSSRPTKESQEADFLFAYY